MILNDATVVDNGIDISQFVDNLPGFSNGKRFMTELRPSTDTFEDFGDQIMNYGHEVAKKPPWFYGSYFMYEADLDQQKYKFVSFVNTTSQDGPGLFP